MEKDIYYLDTVSKIALALNIDIRLLFEPLNDEIA